MGWVERKSKILNPRFLPDFETSTRLALTSSKWTFMDGQVFAYKRIKTDWSEIESLLFTGQTNSVHQIFYLTAHFLYDSFTIHFQHLGPLNFGQNSWSSFQILSLVLLGLLLLQLVAVVMSFISWRNGKSTPTVGKTVIVQL